MKKDPTLAALTEAIRDLIEIIAKLQFVVAELEREAKRASRPEN